MTEIEIIRKVLNNWRHEIESKVNDYPRKITHKQYIKEFERISTINQAITKMEMKE